MLSTPRRFGEHLARIVPLDRHSVEEILQEQRLTGRRFGEVVLNLGLCTPLDLWLAWAAQLADGPQTVNLDIVGIDCQALAMVDAEVAIDFGIVPVRSANNLLVVAVAPANHPRAVEFLPGVLGVELRFVLAPQDDIDRAIRTFYVATV